MPCLLFFETAFGIRLGCKLYEWATRKPPEWCLGGIFAVELDPRVQPRLRQALVLLAYLVSVFGIACHCDVRHRRGTRFRIAVSATRQGS